MQLGILKQPESLLVLEKEGLQQEQVPARRRHLMVMEMVMVMRKVKGLEMVSSNEMEREMAHELVEKLKQILFYSSLS